MSTVDLSGIAMQTAQLKGLQDAMAQATDPIVKQMLQSQVTALSSQISAGIAHAQAQQEAASNLIDGLNLFSTLQNLAGGLPGVTTIVNLFRK